MPEPMITPATSAPATTPPAPRPPPPVARPPFTGRENPIEVARYVAATLNRIHTLPDGQGRWAAHRYEEAVVLVGTPLTVAVKLVRKADGTRHWSLAATPAMLAVSGFPEASGVTLKVASENGSANWARLVEAATVYLARRADLTVREALAATRGAALWTEVRTDLAWCLNAATLAGLAPAATSNWNTEAADLASNDMGRALFTWRFPAGAVTYRAQVEVRKVRATTVEPGVAFDARRFANAHRVTLRLCGDEQTVTIREAFRAVAAMSAAAEAHKALTARDATVATPAAEPVTDAH